MIKYTLPCSTVSSGKAVKLTLPCSTIAGVNKVYRLRCAINARVNKLCKYFKLVMDSNAEYQDVLQEELGVLNTLIYKLDQSVANNVIITKADDVHGADMVYKEVFELWKGWPGFEEHCIRLFGCFTPFSKYNLRFKLEVMEKKKKYFLDSGVDCTRINALIDDEKFNCDFLEFVLGKLLVATREGRKNEVMRRLTLEIEHKIAQGWYVIFNTLTVNDWNMPKVFPDKRFKGMNYWQLYIKKMDRCFAKASYGSVRKASGHDYHEYFAVVERGSASKRLHIHVLHIFKTLPIECSDPNVGATEPYYREIDYFKRFWSYGNTSPIAARFNRLDSFGRLGWRWPVKQEMNADGKFSYENIIEKPCRTLAFYLGKYLTKTQGIHEKEVGCIWRTRLSRKLGQRVIKEILVKVPLKYRLLLLRMPKLKLKHGLTRMPRLLLRRLLVGSLPGSILRALFQRGLLSPPLSLLRRWQSMIRGTVVYSPLNVGSFRMVSLHAKAVFSYFVEGALYATC